MISLVNYNFYDSFLIQFSKLFLFRKVQIKLIAKISGKAKKLHSDLFLNELENIMICHDHDYCKNKVYFATKTKNFLI